MKKLLILFTLTIMITVMLMVTVGIAQTESSLENKDFISTKIQNDVNKVILFKPVGKTQAYNNVDESSELMYTSMGTLEFKLENDKTRVWLMQSIYKYSESEIINLLFRNEIENLLFREEYTDDILKALGGDEKLINKYFENDVLTQDILEYTSENIDKQYKLKVLTGISDKGLTRVCILGVDSQTSKDIGLKIVLKLNNRQKVYDIDVY